MAQIYPEDRGTNYAVRSGNEAAEMIVSELRKIDDNRSHERRVPGELVVSNAQPS
jgi:hypothetical protein